jgi:hypothetical protein
MRSLFSAQPPSSNPSESAAAPAPMRERDSRHFFMISLVGPAAATEDGDTSARGRSQSQRAIRLSNSSTFALNRAIPTSRTSRPWAQVPRAHAERWEEGATESGRAKRKIIAPA